MTRAGRREATDDGGHAVLDGTRSGDAQAVRQQDRRVVARHHGDRNDIGRAALPQRDAPARPLPDRHQRAAQYPTLQRRYLLDIVCEK